MLLLSRNIPDLICLHNLFLLSLTKLGDAVPSFKFAYAVSSIRILVNSPIFFIILDRPLNIQYSAKLSCLMPICCKISEEPKLSIITYLVRLEMTRVPQQIRDSEENNCFQ